MIYYIFKPCFVKIIIFVIKIHTKWVDSWLEALLEIPKQNKNNDYKKKKRRERKMVLVHCRLELTQNKRKQTQKETKTH